MIAIDTNVLVSAHRRDARWHTEAVDSMTPLLNGAGPWAIPWPCVHEFVGVVTRAGIFDPPSTLEEAVIQVEIWLDSPTLHVLHEGPEHWLRLRTLLTTSRTTGARIHDARIAAICLEHGVRELWTADRDFSRFPQLRTRNPLVASPR